METLISLDRQWRDIWRTGVEVGMGVIVLVVGLKTQQVTSGKAISQVPKRLNVQTHITAALNSVDLFNACAACWGLCSLPGVVCVFEQLCGKHTIACRTSSDLVPNLSHLRTHQCAGHTKSKVEERSGETMQITREHGL
jgi:hypothetical protein